MKKILEVEKKVVSLQKQRDEILCKHNCNVFAKIWEAMLKCIAFSNCIGMNDPIKAFSEVYRLAYTTAKDSENRNDGVIINSYTKSPLPGHRGIMLRTTALPPIDAAELLQYFANDSYLAKRSDDGNTLRLKSDELNEKLELIIELCRRVSITDTLQAQRRESDLIRLKERLENQVSSFKAEA